MTLAGVLQEAGLAWRSSPFLPPSALNQYQVRCLRLHAQLQGDASFLSGVFFVLGQTAFPPDLGNSGHVTFV